jgi:hypothetical protein
MGCLRYLPASLWFIALPALGGIVPPFPRVRYDRAVTVSTLNKLGIKTSMIFYFPGGFRLCVMFMASFDELFC